MNEINILEIMNLFISSNIYELNLEYQNLKLYINKKNEGASFNDLKKNGNIQADMDIVEEKNNKIIEVKSSQVGTIISLNYVSNIDNSLIKTEVKKGEVLCILEAMKMLNEVVSPIDGTIKSIKVKENEIVEYGQVLFEIEED